MIAYFENILMFKGTYCAWKWFVGNIIITNKLMRWTTSYRKLTDGLDQLKGLTYTKLEQLYLGPVNHDESQPLLLTQALPIPVCCNSYVLIAVQWLYLYNNSISKPIPWHYIFIAKIIPEEMKLCTTTTMCVEPTFAWCRWRECWSKGRVPCRA